MMTRATSPTSLTLFAIRCMLVWMLNDCALPSTRTHLRQQTRLKSAPAAARRGTMVSLMASSALRMMTLPIGVDGVVQVDLAGFPQQRPGFGAGDEDLERTRCSCSGDLACGGRHRGPRDGKVVSLHWRSTSRRSMMWTPYPLPARVIHQRNCR